VTGGWVSAKADYKSRPALVIFLARDREMKKLAPLPVLFGRIIRGVRGGSVPNAHASILTGYSL